MPLGNSGINPGLAASNPALELQAAVRRGESFSGNERHVVLQNREGEFADVSGVTGLDLPDDGRAACFSDWDGDGDLDLWVSNRSAPQLRYFENSNPGGGRGLIVKLIGTACSRDAVGARAKLVFADEAPQIRSVTAGSGFLAQSSKILHFGLGQDAVPQQLIVYWPGQEKPAIIDAVGPGRFVLTQGEATLRPAALSPPSDPPPTAAAPPPAERTLLAQPLPIATLFDRPEQAVGKPLLIVLSDGNPKSVVPEWLALQVLDIATLKARAPERLRCLQIARDHLFDVMDRADPTPLGLMIDAEDNLRAIYFGAVDAKQLEADFMTPRDPVITPRDISVPFPGRWVANATPEARPLDLAEDLLDAGLLDAAKEYIERYDELLRQDELYPQLIGRLRTLQNGG